jgi:hypothetical protein
MVSLLTTDCDFHHHHHHRGFVLADQYHIVKQNNAKFMTHKAWILLHFKNYLCFKLITSKMIQNHIVSDVEVQLFWIIQCNTNDVLPY